LILGYFSLTLSIAAIVFLLTLKTDDNGTLASNPPQGSTANERLRDAELMVTAHSGPDVGMGNTAEARQIATEFAELMKTLNDELFTSDRKRVLQLSRGNFLTYCELHPGSCALIVHVPSYRDYDDDARAALADIAWTAALAKTSGALQSNDDLAVALRGTFLYGDIMLGSYPSDPQQPSDRREGDSDDLLPFFPVAATMPSSPPMESLPNVASSATPMLPPQSIPPQDTSIPNANFPPANSPPANSPPANSQPANDPPPSLPARSAASTPPTEIPPTETPPSSLMLVQILAMFPGDPRAPRRSKNRPSRTKFQANSFCS
jgi:hypothetical protein